MPVFNVGDKIKCIHHRGVPDQFTPGAIYVVASCRDNHVSIVSDDGGNPNGWLTKFFELAVDAVVDEREEVVFYTIIYNFNGERKVASYNTQERAENTKQQMIHVGNYEILALKKIKVKI